MLETNNCDKDDGLNISVAWIRSTGQQFVTTHVLSDREDWVPVGVGGRPGFPGGASGKESTCQCWRCRRWGFDPLAGKIPWRRKWQPTPVFLREIPWTEEPDAVCGPEESQIWLSNWACTQVSFWSFCCWWWFFFMSQVCWVFLPAFENIINK